MFIGDEMCLGISFAIARERLMRLGESSALFGASDDAYGTARVGVAGVSKLVRVQARELSWANLSVGMALRWEASGPGGGLFPVLDADLTLTPAPAPVPGHGPGSLLTLAGVYRPPLGPLGEVLDRAILNRVATATVRGFLARVAAQLADQPVPNGAGSPEANA
jgi:hypothetical protein